MLVDALFDRFVSRLRRSRRQEYGELSSTPKAGRPKPKPRGRSSGMFNGASNIIINNPTFNDVTDRTQITQHFAAGKPGLDPVLEHIAPYTDLDATMDSSARFPPPSCHPGTRLKIGNGLFSWLNNHQRRWNMIWLHGPAGTGKSAVAQTFAERCAANGRLGASFFFSRPNDRNNPDTVIPSLVYQLAVCLPDYKSLVTAQLANDPELLRKARPTLFKKLIIEPLSQLQTQKRKRIREPLLVVLDGLDECKGEDAQREFVEMISELTRLKHDFPLIWLICSRPEAHLKYLFSRADFTVNCGRAKLVIDAESIADVNLYLRDGLAGIKDHFWDATDPLWPPEEQFTELSHKASGHFAFASTALRYIGDQTYAAPMARLDALLSFLSGIKTGTANPLAALDALYTRILRDVPDDVLPIVKQILGNLIDNDYLTQAVRPTQPLCNFLHIDQATFYRAFRKLHSVIDVPLPRAASNTVLPFYHASFQDYLRDVNRSGEFFIANQDYMLGLAKACLFWYQADSTLFHATDGWEFNQPHEHGILPDLKWVSDDSRAEISRTVADNAQMFCWQACSGTPTWDEALLSQIHHFDFRYIEKADNLDKYWGYFVNRLWEVDSSSGIIRTEPRSEVDFRLLDYMKSMIEPVVSSKPATFPLDVGTSGGQYFLLGYDSKAIVSWTTDRSPYDLLFGALNCEQAPPKEQIDDYQAWLTKEEWGDISDEEGSDISEASEAEG